ncbi:MAG: hypothetical protein GF333_00550, partial [Candidatus Omnitrophica bacterium]|nr:hypothetical protein [Candidatus Omnitrophota bacterium]
MIWIISIGMALLGLSLATPFWGLVTYIGVLYLRPMEVYPFLSQFHIARIFGIAMIIGYIVYASRNEERNFFFNAPQDKVF